ncbi:cytochrome P450 [Streptomyces scopuliridis]|uniref:Cytochrome P450 n=1 Tax=Streptomyces scopuliridis RB72 TaxID=1440053 RepID=A0A2T7TGI1_9ACTN|nr:cytochrome P450 [Streptomyces scopuliridis]PVE14211.1 cytochrome P450 [Streptomyces scopuliridis RB72]
MSTQPEPLPYPFTSAEPLELSPLYTELRTGPPPKVRLPYGEDAWLVTRYADARFVLSDPRFSLAAGVERDQPRMRALAPGGDGLLSTDGPEHLRLRGVVARHFSARRIDQMRVQVREVAEGLLDRLQESGPPGDLVQDFAFPLSIAMICDLLGVPVEDRHRIRKWLEVMLAHVVDTEELASESGAYFAYLTDLVELRRREPRDDLLTCLVRAHDEGRLSYDEVVKLAVELLTGGFVTTYNQIPNFCYLLLRRPEWLSRLREHPSDIPAAVEEMLRYVPMPNGLGFPRYATEDVEVGGVLVRAGEPVLVDLSAANRDPAVFRDAETLVLDRVPEAPHLIFGHGAHFCVGARLARLELEVALGTLLDRMPALKLTVSDGELRWKTEAMLKGLHELPVDW